MTALTPRRFSWRAPVIDRNRCKAVVLPSRWERVPERIAGPLATERQSTLGQKLTVGRSSGRTGVKGAPL
jgi:hypothetical protein